MNDRTAKSHYGRPVSVSQCPGCAGIWIDGPVVFTLSRDSAVEVDSETRIEEIATEPREVSIYCPRCEIPLNEQTGSGLPKGLRIDYCGTCDGFWFDKGELMIYKAYLESRRQSMRARDAKEREHRERLERIRTDARRKYEAIAIELLSGLG
jgi:Zn-finger nucleic acid-binding protein